MKKILSILLLIISMQLTGQNVPTEFLLDCKTEHITYKNQLINSSSSICHPYVYDLRDYDSKFIPSSTQSTIPVRVNLIFLQRENGTGNFHKDSIEEQGLLDEVITKINHTYSNLVNTSDQNCYKYTSCYSSDFFIKDTKIQFLFNKI